MKKIVFVIVRYSVLLQSKAWNIAKETDFDSYREKLFSQERLDQHFFFFDHVMLPSVATQVENGTAGEEVDVRLLVITSEDLPQSAKDKLLGALGKHDWADAVFMPPEGNMNREINQYIKATIAGKSAAFATVRLDDDDALHSSYFSSLEKYLTPKFAGHIVSYPKGHAVLFDQGVGKITSALEVYYPKIALGLALVNYYDEARGEFSHKPMNIFQAGKHTTVQERYPLILDESLSGYVRMCYRSSDTAEEFYKKRKKVSTEVSPEQAFLGFSVKLPLVGKG